MKKLFICTAFALLTFLSFGQGFVSPYVTLYLSSTSVIPTYKGEIESTIQEIPQVGKYINVSFSATSVGDISNLTFEFADKSQDANYWLVLTDTPSIAKNISAGEQFSCNFSLRVFKATPSESPLFVNHLIAESNNTENSIIIEEYSITTTISDEPQYEILGCTAINSVLDNIEVSVSNHTIICSAENFQLFNLLGQNVTTQNGNLTTGVYVVETKQGSQKVFVK